MQENVLEKRRLGFALLNSTIVVLKVEDKKEKKKYDANLEQLWVRFQRGCCVCGKTKKMLTGTKKG